MRVLLAALMVALVACTASAAPIPTPTAVSTPTATASDDELKKCVAAIIAEFQKVDDSEDQRDRTRALGGYDTGRPTFGLPPADNPARLGRVALACAEYLE